MYSHLYLLTYVLLYVLKYLLTHVVILMYVLTYVLVRLTVDIPPPSQYSNKLIRIIDDTVSTYYFSLKIQNSRLIYSVQDTLTQPQYSKKNWTKFEIISARHTDCEGDKRIVCSSCSFNMARCKKCEFRPYLIGSNQSSTQVGA